MSFRIGLGSWIIPGKTCGAFLCLLIYLLKKSPHLFHLFRRMLWHCFAVKLQKYISWMTKLNLTFHPQGFE